MSNRIKEVHANNVYCNKINVSIYRGEKLYVTKDKRAEKRKSKLCWILCIGIVAAVIILGILAACKSLTLIQWTFIYNLISYLAGTFSKSETPVEARQFGEKSNNTVVGASFGGGLPSETTKSDVPITTTTTTTETPTVPPFDEIMSVPTILANEEERTFG